MHVHQCTWHQGLDTWVSSKDRGWAFNQLAPKDLLGRMLDRPGRHKCIKMAFCGWLQFPPQGKSLPDSEGRFGHWVGVDCVLCLYCQHGSLELDKFSAVSVDGNPWSWWWTAESNRCCQVEWFRRSQPKGLEHLFRMSSLSRHVTLRGIFKKDPEVLERLCLAGRSVWGEGKLGPSAQSASSVTLPQIKWMKN